MHEWSLGLPEANDDPSVSAYVAERVEVGTPERAVELMKEGWAYSPMLYGPNPGGCPEVRYKSGPNKGQTRPAAARVWDGHTGQPCTGGNHRNTAHFESVSTMVLDVDSGVTMDEVRQRLMGFRYAIVATKSHRKEKDGKPPCDRFRVVLWLDKPITDAAEYAAAWAWAVERFTGNKADPATKDVARFYFSSPADAVTFVGEGATMFVPPSLPRPIALGAVIKGQDSSRSLAGGSEAFERFASKGHVESGFRHRRLIHWANAAYEAGLGEADAIEHVWRRNAQYCRPPKEETEVESVVDYVYHSPTKTFGCRLQTPSSAANSSAPAAPGNSMAIPVETAEPKRLLRYRSGDYIDIPFPRSPPLLGQFRKGTVAAIYAGPNERKTWLAMEVARQATVAGHKVLYLLEEGDHGSLQDRFRWMRSYEVDVAPLNEVALLDPEWLQLVIQNAREVAADMIVLDPLSDMVQCDDTDQEKMVVVRTALKRLKRETGACVVVLHHSSKSGSRKGQNDMGAALENMRGSSVLGGSVDLALELRDAGGEEDFSHVFMTKNRAGKKDKPGTVRVIWDRTVEPWRADVHWVHGDEAADAYRKKLADNEKQKEVDTELVARVRDALPRVVRARPGCSMSEAKAAATVETGAKEHVARKQLDALIAEGVIRKDDSKGNKAQLYVDDGLPLPLGDEREAA
jgi:hypothetical protein